MISIILVIPLLRNSSIKTLGGGQLLMYGFESAPVYSPPLGPVYKPPQTPVTCRPQPAPQANLWTCTQRKRVLMVGAKLH